MKIEQLCARPEPALAAALARFELQFRYPLGPGRWFRIDHGDDYPRFFRAIGEAACFVALDGGEVLGTIGCARARLREPGGTTRDVVYLGDLKLDPGARGGRVLLRLIAAVRGWAEPWADAAFAVVMDGTAVTPERYTGRVGVPRFVALAHIEVLRVPARAGGSVRPVAARLPSSDAFALVPADPALRSELAPTWLALADGRASGRLDDTRRAKRLFADDGSELASLHLGALDYADAEAAAELVQLAAAAAASHSAPAVFVAFPATVAREVHARLADDAIVRAPATIWGTGLPLGRAWNIDTAAI